MILQYLDNKVIAEYIDLNEASTFSGISKRKIRRTLNGETSTGGGYRWVYSTNVKKEESELDILKKEVAQLRSALLKKEFTERPKVSETARRVEPFTNGDPNNVIVIGDIHEPFCREGYLEHCRTIQQKYNCGTVVFIGDVIDNHYSSYHETDPDGVSAKDELEHAISKIQQWYYTFPNASVCIGNHDAIITRKAFSSGLSNKWIKSYSEVLGTPNWKFDMSFDIKGVYYYHGTGSSGEKAAFTRAMNIRQPVVQGHLHTVANIQYNASNKDLIWGMQVGCGIDDTKYAFAYAQQGIKKSIISCGVVLNGRIPIIEPMSL